MSASEPESLVILIVAIRLESRNSKFLETLSPGRVGARRSVEMEMHKGMGVHACISCLGLACGLLLEVMGAFRKVGDKARAKWKD
jgi:hypothetical protein